MKFSKFMLLSAVTTAFFAFTAFTNLTFSNLEQPNEELAALIWGKIKATSDAIVNVKKTEFEGNINEPLKFMHNGKEVVVTSAHVNLFPFSTESDPVQVDFVNGNFSEEARQTIKTQVKWGTKVFFEDVTYSVKGKPKKMPNIGIKIN